MNWLLQVFDPANIGAFFTQFQADMQTPAFWLAVGKIIWINVLLSGDNALVIAMACRGLAPRQRLWGMVIGAGIAVVLLIVFTGIVATLMVLPYLKLVGGLALLVIAAKLLVPEDEGDDVTAGTSLWHAIRIVVIADIVMSLDNVIAVAAAANGELSLLILGLAISIPMIIAGAALIMLVLDRLPDPGLARRDAAGLDRRRRDRDRSGGSIRCWSGLMARLRPISELSEYRRAQVRMGSPAVYLLDRGRDRRAGGRLDLAQAQTRRTGGLNRPGRTRRLGEPVPARLTQSYAASANSWGFALIQ